MDDSGRLMLQLLVDSRLAHSVARARPDIPVVVEVTDVAPVAMRERVRAQVSVNGVMAVVGHRYGAGADQVGTAVALVDAEELAQARRQG
jgi:hypothetical protein